MGVSAQVLRTRVHACADVARTGAGNRSRLIARAARARRAARACASRETFEEREGAPAVRRRSLRANAGAGDAGGYGAPVSVLTLICILRPVE